MSSTIGLFNISGPHIIQMEQEREHLKQAKQVYTVHEVAPSIQKKIFKYSKITPVTHSI